MRILCLNPNGSPLTTAAIGRVADAWAGRHPGWGVQIDNLPDAPDRLDTSDDFACSTNQISRRVAALVEEDFDAMIVTCHSDPGLPDGWISEPVPVIGMGWASMRRAANAAPWGMLCHSPALERAKWAQALRYGLADRLREVTGAERDDYSTGSPDALKDLVTSVADMARQGLRSIVLGSAAMSGLAEQVGRSVDVEIIEPVEAALERARQLLIARGKTDR